MAPLESPDSVTMSAIDARAKPWQRGSLPVRLAQRLGRSAQDRGGGISQQPLVRTIQRPAEHVAGSEQAVDAVVVGNDPGCQPCVDAVPQGADVLEMAADLREVVVVPLLRGGEHRGGLAVVRRNLDHYPDDVAPLL